MTFDQGGSFEGGRVRSRRGGGGGRGSSEQRQRWFTVGYEQQDPSACDTFATDDL